MWTKWIVRVTLLIAGAAIVWGIISACQPSRTWVAVLPSGLRVSARLADVCRVDSQHVRVAMELSWKPRRGEELVIPDLSISRPKAELSSYSCSDFRTSFPSAWYGAGTHDGPALGDGDLPSIDCSGPVRRACYTTYLSLSKTTKTVDIVQPLYTRCPDSAVTVEIPLPADPEGRVAKCAGTAKVELLGWRRNGQYDLDRWQPVMNMDSPVTSAPDVICVMVRQTDSSGSLAGWHEFAPSDTQGSESLGRIMLLSKMKGGTCTAELVDDHGKAAPLLGSLIARSDCMRLTDKVVVQASLGFRLIRGTKVVPGRGIKVVLGPSSVGQTAYVPGNGRWVYIFQPKRPSTSWRVRLRYILPPSPRSGWAIHFRDIPI